MKATLKNYRQSPRKVRLVAESLKGKSLEDVLATLEFAGKRAADPLSKLVRSAAANAEKQGEDLNALFIKNITVDEGVTLFRMMPRARGAAYRIRKRSSHVTVTLAKGKKK